MKRWIIDGFTLIELLVVIAISVILATTAVPAFSNFIDNQRVRGGAQDLYSSLQFARSEAVKRNSDVVVAATDWADGWTVSADSNVVREHDGLTGLTIVNSSTTRLVFESDGRLAASGEQTIDICNSARSSAVRQRRVTITSAGRPRIEQSGDCSK